MNIIAINKVLSNQTRVSILQWLKTPEANFPAHTDLKHFLYLGRNFTSLVMNKLQ